MTIPALSRPVTPDEILGFLAHLGIETSTVAHEAAFTVAESRHHAETIPGAHTKNLFVKDKKGRLFLVVARQLALIDLKRLHETIQASGRVSFGSAEQLMEALGVTPGSVTALAAVNDREGRVTVVIDAGLMAHDVINCHPLINTMTTSLLREGLLAFLRATGHEPMIVALPEPPPSGPT